MSSSKYIVYQCGVCKRETEILLDAKRPDPVRCNITLNCRGKLQRVGERSSKGFLFTPIIPGLDDYIPRFTDVTVPPIPEVNQPISIFTGSGILTVAALQREQVEVTANFFVIDRNGNQVTVEQTNANFLLNSQAYMNLYVYEVTPSMMKYKKYVYEAPNGIQLLRGIDDSYDGKNLRFDSNDTVKVFVNGVELNQTHYDRSVENQITLTPALTDQNSVVEVYVYDELAIVVDEEDLIPLKFRPLTNSNNDLSLRNLTSWGDYGAVEIDGTRRLMLYCLDTTELDINKSYGISKAEMITASGSTVELMYSEIFFLLSREPYMFQDKELHAYVTGSKFIDPTTLLNYRQSMASGVYELVIDYDIIDQVYLPITPVTPVSNITEQPEQQSSIVSGTEDLKRKYILGPS